jgi:glyoxylate carboligase
MACGYAKYTGKLGVCLATSGPGGIHLLDGLHDVKVVSDTKMTKSLELKSQSQALRHL